MDMVGWTQRQKSQIGHRLIFNSARYALAYHEIRKYAPDVVDANFLTPEEFLAQTRALPEAEIRAPVPKFYLPILKPGVQEKWAAARLNGEDRSESGPVKSLYAPAETRSTEDA